MTRHIRSPLGPIRTSLNFQQLQWISGLIEMPLRCGMCRHEFSADATTGDHECNPPTFHVEVVEVKPMPMPTGGIFYEEFQWPMSDPPKEYP